MSKNSNPAPNETISQAQSKSKISLINWGLILTTISTIASLVAIFIALRQQPTKHLRYEVVSSGPLANVTDNVNGRLKVTFDKTAVPDANFALLRVSNDGNQPILAEDFKTPFVFHFGKSPKSNVLDAEITTSTPGDLAKTVTLAKKSDIVSLVPGLLNPSDSITIKVLYAGGDQTVGATARIVGTTISRQDSLPPDTLQIVVAQAKSAWFSFFIVVGGLNALLLGNFLSKNARLKSEIKVISGERGQLLDIVKQWSGAIKAMSEQTDKAAKTMNDYEQQEAAAQPLSQATTPVLGETSPTRAAGNGGYTLPSEEKTVRVGAGHS